MFEQRLSLAQDCIQLQPKLSVAGKGSRSLAEALHVETLLCPIDLMSSDEIQEEHHQAPVDKNGPMESKQPPMDMSQLQLDDEICPSGCGAAKRPRENPTTPRIFSTNHKQLLETHGNPIQNTTLTKPTALVTVELCQKKRFDNSVETRPLIFGPAGTGANDGFCCSCKSV